MNPFPGANYIVAGIFIVCLGATVIGALIAALSARVIRGVCGLALCCLGLAGLYYFLHSPFLALMEILIYIGAVCVTIVFAIMLAEPQETPSTEKRSSAIVWTGLALAVSGAIFYGLYSLIGSQKWTLPAQQADGSVKAIGISLLTTYSLAFELISLVLLVAILGAVAVARGGRKQLDEPAPAAKPEPKSQILVEK
jgi:NADH:ubiquinone oxidoreductase subunit 6 (subunit J)